MTLKGVWKLLTQPHRFIRDYAKKRYSKEILKAYGKRALAVDVPFSLYYYNLFKILKENNNTLHADIAIKKAISKKERPLYYHELALILRKKSQWWQIVDTYEKAFKLKANLPKEWTYKYAEALDEMSRYEKAIEILSVYYEIDDLEINELFFYADLFRKSEQKDEANKIFQKIIALDEENNSKTLGIGIFYENKGLWSLACEFYQERLKEAKNALLLYKLGLSYDRCYDWKNAEIFLLKALALDTTNAHWYYRLGFVLEKQEKWEEAEEAYRCTLERQNNFYPSWHYRLGFVLEKQEKYQEASKAFLEQRILQDAHGLSEEKYNKDKGLKKIINYTEYYERYEIADKTILYESYHGRSISCNPYAIFKELYCDERFKNYKHIWVINDTENIPYELKKDVNIIFVKRESDLYMRYLAKAKYLINNVTFSEYFIRKEGQLYLNTWHGTPIKSLGKDIKDDFMAHKNVTRNFLQASHLIQPNSYTTNILLDKYDVRNICSAVVAETGYPRQDLMLNISNKGKELLKNKLNIDNNEKVVLYAPTWRGEHGQALFDTDHLAEDLRLLGEIKNIHFLFRGHHMIEDLISNENFNTNIVPSEIDTNTLLSIVDILITDYSSIAFDYMALARPIIYYAYDRELYEKERGLYFPLEELGGNVCINQEELLLAVQANIKKVTINQIQKKAQQKFCQYDKGTATQKVIDFVFFNIDENLKLVNVSNRKNILLYGGPFIPNGITTSFVNLLNHINTARYSITIVIEPKLLKKNPERIEQFNRLKKDVKIIARTGQMLMNLEEKWIKEKFNSQNTLASDALWNKYFKAYSREYRRMFGESNFYSIINFEGYNVFWAGVFTTKQGCIDKNSIYLHNDMYGEWKLRFPYLEKNFKLYNFYTSLISVSKKTNEHNIENLSSIFNLKKENFLYCDNVQNPKNTLERAKEVLENKEDEKIFKNTKVFINIARLSPEKDQEKLIRAFEKVAKLHKEARLINLGSGALEGHLKSLIKDLKLEKKVFLLGQRLNPYPYLNKSDCFVLSSNHEGQPMTLFEALILKKPIIATDIVGNRSVLEGRPGLLVENSEEGLVNGMLDFLEGRYIETETFDYEEYNQNALNMFYGKVVH